jgi:hypothetical protein
MLGAASRGEARARAVPGLKWVKGGDDEGEGGVGGGVGGAGRGGGNNFRTSESKRLGGSGSESLGW